ncbi:MAG TPA: TRAP transporter large permease subunit, partial [Firmicutes bacterium]|nr:TRAP transporter large permease subunit [Bacillota bacterium]
IVAADVFFRHFLKSPIRGTYEIVQHALLTLIFLGIAHVQVKKRHLSINIISKNFSKGVQALVDCVNYVTFLFIFYFFIKQSIVQGNILRARGAATTLLSMPRYLFLYLVAFGMFLLCFVFLIDYLKAVERVIQIYKNYWLPFLATVLPLGFLYFLIWHVFDMLNISSTLVGFIAIIVMVLLLLMGWLIGPVLLTVGFLGLTYLSGLSPSMSTLGLVPYRTGSDYVMSTIPLFVLMGMFCFRGGLSSGIYNFFHKWLGRLPGGLAMATVGASAGFAAVSGNSTTTAVTIGTVALPEMRRYNYDDGLATASAAAGGTIGSLIPPSNPLIIYGILTELSIGTLFIAGIVPGILEALLYIGMIYFLCRRNPALGPPGPAYTWRERFFSLKETWAILALFAIVIGGIYLGFFTATEAAGVGAFFAFVIGLIKGELKWDGILDALNDAIRNTGMIFLMMTGARIFGNMIMRSGLPRELVSIISNLAVPGILIVFLIMLVYIVLGCIMPLMGVIIITVPILYPIILELGFDGIWFGILLVMAQEMGQITPPVGVNVMAIAGVAEDVPLGTIYRGAFPFFLMDLVRFLLLLFIPSIILYLPSIM